MIIFNGNNYDGNLSVQDDGFFWKGSKIFYNDVTSLDFSWGQRKTIMNGSELGTVEKVELQVCSKYHPDIYLKNKEVEFALFFYWRRLKDTAKKIREFYALLETETLKARFEWYMRQLEENGYFVYNTSFLHGSKEYSKAEFKLPNKLVFGINSFDLSEYRISKSIYQIVLRPKNENSSGLKGKNTIDGTTSIPTIFCRRDYSVLSYILEKKFNLSF
jgi:hypothetical protein